MPDGSRLPWTDEQWAMAQRIVQESARKARVASSFLPLVGPLPNGQASISALGMASKSTKPPHPFEAAQRFEVDDEKALRFTRTACNVYLKAQQADDPALGAARQMLSRAADIIGRLEDAVVFNGQPGEDDPPARTGGIPKVYTVRGGQKHDGLLGGAGQEAVDLARGGKDLVRAVIAGVQRLERRGHYGPFACVLGSELYKAANTPSRGSLVLPSDRITPFLEGGPLRRSSVVPRKKGVIVALAGSPVDLVVASDVHVSYVQLTLEPRFVLRVSERFVLRIKQTNATCRLEAQ